MIASAGMAVRTAAAALLCLSFGELAAAVPEKVGRAVVTFYWVVDEKSPAYDSGQPAVLRDPRGRVLAHTTRKFKLELVKQGSGWLRDGRTVIYIKRVAGESRFKISRSRYGLASSGCRLVPYRTIAVDPQFVPVGTKVSIPQLKGAHLPDGTIHDGMFVAADRGHFRGAHVDLFVGAGAAAARPFIRRGYGSRSYVTVYRTGRTKKCHP